MMGGMGGMGGMVRRTAMTGGTVDQQAKAKGVAVSG